MPQAACHNARYLLEPRVAAILETVCPGPPPFSPFNCASVTVVTCCCTSTCFQGNLMCIVHLLACGAQHALTDNDGDTAMHYAAYTGEVRGAGEGGGG